MLDDASIGAGTTLEARFWCGWLRDRELFLRMCRRWLRGNRHEAEDVVSRGALKALDFLRSSPTGVERFQAWALRILYHLCVDIARMRWRDGGRFADDEGDRHTVVVASRDVAPERVIYREQLAAAIEQAVGTLPPRMRSVFCMRFVDDLSYDEISRELAISPVNARKRIQQARELLRESLNPYAGGGLR